MNGSRRNHHQIAFLGINMSIWRYESDGPYQISVQIQQKFGTKFAVLILPLVTKKHSS
jgi:hypothetical protein